jgi:cytochrome c oxidase subunit 1
MAMAGIFSLFAATYYWFPLMTGRLLNERLGKLHFWVTILAAYATFLPMHFTGLAGEPRQYAQLSGVAGVAGQAMASWLPLQRFITWAALVLASGQIFFLANVLYSCYRGKIAASNPWQATTLEWAEESEGPLTAYTGASEYGIAYGGEDYHPQWQPEASEE